jgi:site-specific DNA recombinase
VRTTRETRPLIDAYENGLLSKEEFEPRIQSRKERLAYLEKEVASLATVEEQRSQLRLAIGQLDAFSQQISAGLDSADFATKREIIRALVKRIEIGQDDVRVVYRISPRPFVPGPVNGAIFLQNCRSRQDVFRRTLTPNADETSCKLDVSTIRRSTRGDALRTRVPCS